MDSFARRRRRDLIVAFCLAIIAALVPLFVKDVYVQNIMVLTLMYAALSQAAFSTAGSLYRSDDVAQTWRRIDHGVKAESTVMALSVHPADPARVYCVTRSGQVIGTEDSGKSWTDYRLPDGVHDVYAVACT